MSLALGENSMDATIFFDFGQLPAVAHPTAAVRRDGRAAIPEAATSGELQHAQGSTEHAAKRATS